MKIQKVTSIDKLLQKAAAQKTFDEELHHAERTYKEIEKMLEKRMAKIEALNGFPCKEASTGKFNVNGHSVEFKLNQDENGKKILSGIIDKKRYVGDDMLPIINEVDGFTLNRVDKMRCEMWKKGEEIATNLHRDAPVIRRTAAISAVRKAESTLKAGTRQADTILSVLMRMIGRSMSHPGR